MRQNKEINWLFISHKHYRNMEIKEIKYRKHNSFITFYNHLWINALLLTIALIIVAKNYFILKHIPHKYNRSLINEKQLSQSTNQVTKILRNWWIEQLRSTKFENHARKYWKHLFDVILIFFAYSTVYIIFISYIFICIK